MSAAKPPTVLSSCSSGDIVALASDLLVAGDSILLSAGSLLRIGWHKDAATFARFVLPDGEWSHPTPCRGSAPVKLVSTITQQLAGRVVDSAPVVDPTAGRPVEQVGTLPWGGEGAQ